MILLNIARFVILKNNSPIPKSPLTPPPLLRYDPAEYIFGSSMTNKTTTHAKFSSTLFQTDGFQIMTVYFMHIDGRPNHLAISLTNRKVLQHYLGGLK